MTDWTRILRAVAPRARKDIIAAFVALDAEIEAAGITTDLRRAHFLAQVVPESAWLTKLEESLNYTAPERIRSLWKSRFPTVESARPFVRNPKALAEKVYGGRMGNVRPGDGWRYRGGGLGQTTGRANYRAAGFEDKPEALRTPDIALRSALTFWVDNGCAAYADRDDVVGLRRRWNGGENGLKDTKETLAKAKAVLRTLPAQAKLKALRYPVGALDGKHEARTTGAVSAFQAQNGLPLTGELDDATVAALDTAAPIAPAAKDANLLTSRTVQGSATTSTIGAGIVIDQAMALKDQIEQANTQISAGTMLGLIAGLLIVGGALYALYARWDDAGRPLPGFLARRFSRLAGIA